MCIPFEMIMMAFACRVDPFASDSPLKSMGITHFPPDVFFVLRVMQLLRGLAGGMKVWACFPCVGCAMLYGPYPCPKCFLMVTYVVRCGVLLVSESHGKRPLSICAGVAVTTAAMLPS